MNGSKPSRARGLALLILCLTVFVPPEPVEAQNRARQRYRWQRVDEVIRLVGAGPGSSIADIGAGSGYFTRHLSRSVGPDGRVYAVDVSEKALARLRELAGEEEHGNVEVVVGAVDDPRLPPGGLDGVLVVNAYHEMTEHRAMLAGIRRGLRPGGRLIILDNRPPQAADSRRAQSRRHSLSMERARDDLIEAGFEVVSADPRFTRGGRAMWLLVARSPG